MLQSYNSVTQGWESLEDNNNKKVSIEGVQTLEDA
jgi:hypothetical protein